MPDAQVVEWIREKYTAVFADLDERARRRWAAAEARSLGWGVAGVVLRLWRWQLDFPTGPFAAESTSLTIPMHLQRLNSVVLAPAESLASSSNLGLSTRWRDLSSPVRAVTLCRRFVGHARALVPWLVNSRDKDSPFAATRWDDCSAPVAIACKPTARPWKASSIPIGMRSSDTSADE